MNPTISIIIPSFNHGSVINNAIQSVLQQTYSNIEIVVVDDASTDDTEKIITRKADSRIVYVKNSENMGPDHAFNIGTDKSIGDYICLLDADDTMPRNSLQDRLSHIAEDNYDAVHTGTTISSNGTTKYIAPLDTRIPEKVISFLKQLPSNVGINNATFMYHRRVFEKIGMRNVTKTFFPHNDFEFALRTLLHCNVCILNKSTYEYNKQPNSHSATHGSNINARKKLDNLTRNYLRKFSK